MKENLSQTPLSQLEKSGRSALKAGSVWLKAVGQRIQIKVLDQTGSLPGKPVKHVPSKLSKFKVYYERTPADVDKRSIKNMLRLK